MAVTSNTQDRILFTFVICISLLFISASFFAGPLGELLPGLWRIQISPQVLTTDATAVGGLNGALLNAGLLGLAAAALLRFSGADAGGSMGAFFITLGFAFFGKNLLNIWPIILGSYFHAKLKKEPFKSYAPTALLACALAPLISEVLFNRYLVYPLWLGISAATLLGVIIGLVFPAITAQAVKFHKGHNLFNAGVSAGFFAFLLFSVYRTLLLRPLGLDRQYSLNSVLSEGFPLFFTVLLGIVFLGAIAAGYILSGRSFAGYRTLLGRSGFQADFLASDGVGSVLINFGVLGFVSLAYFHLGGAPFTGPTVGALLNILAWAGKGSHPRNVIPIMLGYWFISLPAAWDLTNQSMAVALCFATGLAPLSGRWGWWWGIAAGALHASIAFYTPTIYGGFNLNNGGFVAGIVAFLLVPVLEAFFKERTPSVESPVE